MKRKICLFLIFLTTAFLGGCIQKRPLCRYVTQVEIRCDHPDASIIRSYTSEDKIAAVLMYIRLLHLSGNPEITTTTENFYQIDLTLSDGSHRIYEQKDHRYFRKPQACWQTIPPEQAAKLYALMAHLESDI